MTRSLFESEMNETHALIALSLVPGVGPGRIRSLIRHFGSAATALNASSRALAAVPGVGRSTADAIRRFEDHAMVEDQFARAERAGARLVTCWDASFPRLLNEIYDPPVFMWMRGDLLPADEHAIAIVGTRRASAYGRRVAAEFAAELATRGITVVSGLAYGIDAAAHQAALKAGGRTLAVLGSGVDRIYPSRHTQLAQQIESQGAVLSEYPLGAAPDAPNFPRRNRIISGLTRGTLVAEAFASGGALITAHMALEQNREVFAVPGALFSPACAGNNQLIQKGLAKLVTSVDDMLVELDGMSGETAPRPDVAESLPRDLNSLEERLLAALTYEPVQIDTLCADTDLDPSTALVYLLSLEFKGLVRQMAGKQFYRI